MSNQNENLLTAIDVGSSKTVALTVEILDGGLRYRAHGIAESRGTRKGIIVDLDKAVTSVQKAVSDAEAMLGEGVNIERAVVGIGGPHIRGVNSQGGISLGTRPREIMRDDMRAAIDKARAIALPNDREVLHLLPQEFLIDNQNGIHDPLGMPGMKLEVRVHVVTSSITATQNVVTVLNKAGIHVDDTIYEPMACADSVLRGDERELGVCLCDIGAGSTELIVFHEGAVAFAGVVPIGGDYFTSDVAVGLRTPLTDAEKIKRMFGCAVVTNIPEANEIEVPTVGDKPSRLMSQRFLGEILEPRARELFEMIRDVLRQAGVMELCGVGLVLVGGGAKLPGLSDIIDSVVRKPARVAMPTAIAKMPALLQEPEYAAVIGMLLYAYRARAARGKEEPTFKDRLKALFARSRA